MENNDLRIEINLSELELKLLENEKVSNTWPISAGKEESPTPNGIFHSSMKITQDNLIHRIYRRHLRRRLIHLPYYKQMIGTIKNLPRLYKKFAGKSTYIDGRVITLRNGNDKFINTSIHGWHNFQQGYLTKGCIRVPYPAIKELLEKVEEGTQVKIY